MSPLVQLPAWFSDVLFSVHAVCLAADADTLPSAGAAPAEMLTAPTGEVVEVKTGRGTTCLFSDYFKKLHT